MLNKRKVLELEVMEVKYMYIVYMSMHQDYENCMMMMYFVMNIILGLWTINYADIRNLTYEQISFLQRCLFIK